MPAEEQTRLRDAVPAVPFLQAVSDAELAAGGMADRIAFTNGLAGDPVFHTGRLSEPVKALQTCVNDLMTRWGIDPQKYASSSRQPEPLNNASEWIMSADFSDGFKPGNVHIRVIVGEDGMVRNCLSTLGVDDSRAERVCSLLKSRARFSPGLDAQGNPMVSYWGTSVYFGMLR